MIAALLIVVAAALPWVPGSGSPIASTAKPSELVCRSEETPIDVEADYSVWRTVRVRADSLSFTQPCVLNVTLTTFLPARRKPAALRPLLLVKIERLLLKERTDSFHVLMSNPIRRTKPYCSAEQCGATYLWASASVQLHLFVDNPARANASYEAAFVVTEATNVCGIASRSGELLVPGGGSSSGYVFAPDLGHEALPPNNVTCAPDLQYSITVRSSVASARFTVTALACPSNDSCGTLLLNDGICRDGEKLMAPPQPGSTVMLRYALRRACSEDSSKYAGFVVNAQVDAFAEPPSTSVAGSGRAVTARRTARPATRATLSTHTPWTGRSSSAAAGSRSATPAHEVSADAATISLIGDCGASGSIDDDTSLNPLSKSRACSVTGVVVTTGSSSADATAGRGLDLSDTENESTDPVVPASVAAAAAAALAVGVATALLCRYRRRRRSPPFKKTPSSFVHQALTSTSAIGEEIPMINNALYGVALASRTRADE